MIICNMNKLGKAKMLIPSNAIKKQRLLLILGPKPKSIPEHSSVVERLACIQRVGGSIPSVPIGQHCPLIRFSPLKASRQQSRCLLVYMCPIRTPFILLFFVQRAQHQRSLLRKTSFLTAAIGCRLWCWQDCIS